MAYAADPAVGLLLAKSIAVTDSRARGEEFGSGSFVSVCE
jgi:hypothetical protein